MRGPLHGIGAALLLGVMVGGCAEMDQAMRRADFLDRVFEPGGERTADAPAVAQPAGPTKEPLPVETGAEVAADGGVAAGGAPAPGELPPGWYVPDPPAAPEEPAVAQAAPPPAAAPVSPAVRTAALLRQNPWISRFWSELTAAEQGRVLRALARRGTPGPAPAAGDPMGLADRVTLLFGPPRATS